MNSFSHVFWLGGSPCCGKTSIAKLLAGKYDLQLYHCDDAFETHLKRADPKRHPMMARLKTMTPDEIWMRPVRQQVEEEIALYREEFAMILDDLLALPKARPVLAEGAALLPDCVFRVLAAKCRALWMVPTEGFQREYYPRRGSWVEGVVKVCQNPAQAFRNWMDRDVAFARWVSERTLDLDLKLIQVDGSLRISEYVALLEEHFGSSMSSPAP